MTGNPHEIYHLQSIQYKYRNDTVLNIPSLKIFKGESVGLIGPNGSGKSTLLNLFAFLQNPSEGKILFSGKSLPKDISVLRRRVTLLTQRPYLLKRSVFDNVAYGLHIRGNNNKVEQNVSEALEQVGLPPALFSKRKWHQLSGGEAQRVALAARLILNPDVLLLDEPVASVDQASAEIIRNAIQRIREQKKLTVISTSHDLVWLTAMSDRILRMCGGKIVGSGVENIIHGPWIPYENELWYRPLPENKAIYSVCPPNQDTTAVLHPSDIIISREKPQKTSARNILPGTILGLKAFETGEGIKAEIKYAGLQLICSLTRKSVAELQLFPGDSVWIMFKASALRWT